MPAHPDVAIPPDARKGWAGLSFSWSWDLRPTCVTKHYRHAEARKNKLLSATHRMISYTALRPQPCSLSPPAPFRRPAALSFAFQRMFQNVSYTKFHAFHPESWNKSTPPQFSSVSTGTEGQY